MADAPKPTGRRGGARPGAGRRSDPQRAANQAAAAKFVSEHLMTLLDGLLKIATNKKNDPNVRVRATKELLDRGLGRSLETIELLGDATQPSAASLKTLWETRD